MSDQVGNKKCYLCNSQNLSIKPGSIRDNKMLPIIECGECSIVSLSSFDHMSNGSYEDGYMHSDDIGDGMALDLDEVIAITEEDDSRRYEQFKDLVSGMSVLDFGCGTGGFIKKIRGIANKVHGIELEKRLYDHFKENNLNVYKDLSEISNKKYDIITLFHVLEHIEDPKSLLEKLKFLLNPNGQLIIEVPNIDDALLSLYESIPFSEFNYWSPHLYYYSSVTLKKLILKVDLKINYIKQFQRYPLSNHLYWLAFGKPGGHDIFDKFNDKNLDQLYSKKLAELGKCDTLIASIAK